MSRFLVTSAALIALAGCGERDVILPGERIDVAAGIERPAMVSEARPISLAAPRANADWTHRAGGPAHNIGHVAYSGALTPVWTVNIGAGDSRRARITADPIVAGGVVYTLDSAARVQATSTSGAPLWTRDLVPLLESASSASGGGLAFGANRVFVTTGFGELTALDPATGAVLWTQDLDAPGGSAPTVAGDLVYLAAQDSRAWAIEVETGRIRYTTTGAPNLTSFGGGAGVAVSDDLAIFPFPSGQVIATFRQGGLQRWSSAVAGRRPGSAAARAAGGISGDPVVSGNRLYIGNATGRLAALDLGNGEPVWTAQEGAMGPVVPAGGSVFLVNDLNELVRLDASTGSRIWSVQLPYFEERRLRRQRTVFAHYGPVLAGGRLIVASSDGTVRSFDPVSGAQVAEVALPGGAASRPAVAGGTLYVVTQNGRLAAFR